MRGGATCEFCWVGTAVDGDVLDCRCSLPMGHGGDHRDHATGIYCRNNVVATPDAHEFVNHPAHYGGEDNIYEHVKVVNALGWNYQIGCATKYLWRAGKKPGTEAVQDLEKAIKYIELEIARRKKG